MNRYQTLMAAAAILAASEVRAQDFDYRFSIVDEAAYSKLNLSTPVNEENRTLPQPIRSNTAVSNLYLGYGGLSTSLNFSALASNTTVPDYSTAIRELSYDLSLSDNFDLTVGRKILKWGPGYAFNPTGVVEPQRTPSDPSDRLGQNVGRTLVSLNAFMGRSSLTLVYLNDAQVRSGAFHWGTHDYALRAYTFIKGLDLSGILHYREGDRLEAGTNMSYVIGDGLELHGEFLGKEGSSMTYHDALVSPDPDQIYASFPYTALYDRSDRIFYKLLLGAQYTFENGLNFAAEFYRNLDGLSRDQWNQWWKFIKFQNDIQQGVIGVPPQLIGPSRLNLLWALETLSPKGTMRDYLFGREFYTTGDWSFEFIQLMNADDASVVLVPTVTYRVSQYLSVYGRLTSFLGSSDSEYGALFTKTSSNLGVQVQL